MECEPGDKGCQCFCVRRGCTHKKQVKHWCHEHRPKKITQYELSYVNNGGGYRLFNRDVVAAINIGCKFLATVLGIPFQGLWSRNTCTEKQLRQHPQKFAGYSVMRANDPLSWEAIFKAAGVHDLEIPLTKRLITPKTNIQSTRSATGFNSSCSALKPRIHQESRIH